MKTAEKFWSFVAAGAERECWEWRGGLDSGGYGQLRWVDKTARAHRIAYALAHGEIPAGDGHHGTVVMHSCDNRRCCNPSHLSLGSQGENIADMKSKGRRKGVGAGAENGRCKMTKEQVGAIRIDTRGQRAIALDYGISPAQVQRIRLGKQWVAIQ